MTAIRSDKVLTFRNDPIQSIDTWKQSEIVEHQISSCFQQHMSQNDWDDQILNVCNLTNIYRNKEEL